MNVVKSKLTIIFLLLFSGIAFSQTDDSDTTWWDIGIYASPDYCTRIASGSTAESFSSGTFDAIEKPRIGYTAGLLFSRQLSKRLYFQSGLVFESQGYKTKTLNDTVFDLYDKPLYTKDYVRAIRYNTINIPVILKINLFNASKIKFNAGIGVAPVISLGKYEVMTFEDHTERLISKAERDLNIQAIVNFSVYIPFSDEFSVSIEPTLKYTVLPYNDHQYKGISRGLISPGIGIFFAYALPTQAVYDYYYYNIYKKKNIPANY
ncbi:MAG: outer membrane beta-barrel protein [Bacteroidota bacterium]